MFPLRRDGLTPHSASRSRSAKANAQMPRGAATSHRIGKPQPDTRALLHVLACEPSAELAGQAFDEPETESPRPCAAHAAPRVAHRQRASPMSSSTCNVIVIVPPSSSKAY